MNPIVLSNAISFVGVALALWLGFFNLTRSPQRTLARAGALALWAAGGLFLAALLGSSQLPELDNPAWLVPFRWPAYFVPVLWLHLASALRPPALSSTPQAAIWEPLRSPAAYTGLRPWLLLLYSVAVLLAALDTLAPRLFLPLDPPPTFALTFFLLYALYALACVGLSASNLRSAYQRADAGTPLRPALDWLIRGYLLTGLGGLLLAVAQAGLLADLALLAGIALTGYSLARITALLDGRSVQGDFVYTLLAIALVCAAYLSATLFTYVVYGIPFVTFVFILMLTVISHSLYDWTRTTLDRLFFHGPTRELRANLRALAHEAGGDEGLRTNLHALLAALCQSLGVSRAAVLLRAEDGYIIDSVVGSISSAQPLPAALFDALELTRLSHPTPLGEMALLGPLRLMDRQEGALLLGLREPGGE